MKCRNRRLEAFLSSIICVCMMLSIVAPCAFALDEEGVDPSAQIVEETVIEEAAAEEPVVEEPVVEEPVVEEPVVEEPVVEEPVIEEPAAEEPVTEQFTTPAEDEFNLEKAYEHYLSLTDEEQKVYLESLTEDQRDVLEKYIEEKEARVLYEIGRGAGRFVYVADAMDDFPEDVKKGRFNPICAFYGEDAVLRDGKEVFLSPEVAGELMRATLLDLSKTASCAELICDGGDAGLSAIVRNVLYLGMPETMKKICKRRVHPAADTEGKNK